MGNVDMGKYLKTLPIMVINIWVNFLPMAEGDTTVECQSPKFMFFSNKSGTERSGT